MCFPERQYPSAVFQYLYQWTNTGQPQVFGAEALARMQSSHQSLKRPEGTSWRSIDYNMVVLLTGGQLPQPIPHLFINVSQYSLWDDESFDRWVCAIKALSDHLLKKFNTRLVIEVTELIPDNVLSKRWERIKACGVLLAIDDYGTGLSNITRLLSHPWDMCKFDMVETLPGEVEHAMSVCRDQGVTGIAEKNRKRASNLLCP